MIRATAIAALLVAVCLPAPASVVDKTTGWELSESLGQCAQVARDTDTTESDCRAYVKQGASALRSAFFGHESADYWSTCVEHNPLFDHRGIDYQAVVECGHYAQDHDGSLQGAFTFSHKRWP